MSSIKKTKKKTFDYYNLMEPLKRNPENNGKQNLVQIKLWNSIN